MLRSAANPSATPLAAVMSRYRMLCSCFSGTAMLLVCKRIKDSARSLRRLRQHRELRDVVVPLDNRRDVPEPPHRALIERPYFVANRMIVRIEQMRSVIAMPREMVLHDALDRH